MAKRINQADRNQFVSAAVKGDTAGILAGLAAGISPDAASAVGMSALYAAANWNKIEIVKILLDAGANPNQVVTEQKNSESQDRSPLNAAVSNGYDQVVDMLLDAGANPRVVATDWGTSAHKLIGRWPALKGDEGAEEYLKSLLGRMLAMGVPVNQVNAHSESLLSLAVVGDAPVSILEWLVDQGADVRTVAEQGRSMLHVAAIHDHLDAVRFFADKGVGIDTPDQTGRTPLFDAGPDEIAAELLRLGANVHHQDIHGRTPLCDLIVNLTGSSAMNRRALQLVDAGADLDQPDFTGKTPRMEIKSRKLDSLQALLAANQARSAFQATISGTLANRRAP